MKNKLISVITPCYNEQYNIEDCYREVKKIFDKHLTKYNYEHIFTDNCSQDNTVEVLKKIASKDPNVKIIVNSRNFGVFRSMFNAISRSSGDGVIPCLAADLQDTPETIIEFIKYW